MLEDLASHLLDIAQNSVTAGATLVEVSVRKVPERRLFEMEIRDNGKGMGEERTRAALDPFCTERTVRRVGMGLPFLKQSTELCGGAFEISSRAGVGTRVFASFGLDNIDIPPFGDLAGAFLTLLVDAPRIHWIFSYSSGKGCYKLDSEDVRLALDDLETLKIPEVVLGLKKLVARGVADSESGI